jgi:hypothetical protein
MNESFVEDGKGKVVLEHVGRKIKGEIRKTSNVYKNAR